MTVLPRKTLSEYLIENKTITPSQIETLHYDVEKSGESIGQAMVRQGLVAEDKILMYYIEACGLTRADLSGADPTITNLVPEATARRYHILPLFKKDGKLVVAMSDPLNIIVIDELKFRTGLEIEPQVSTYSELLQAVNQSYVTMTGTIGELLKSIDSKSVTVVDEETEVARLQNIAEEAPVIKLVNHFITQAHRDRASDIHIEPDESILRIRNRIDGVLYDVAALPKYLQAAVISRSKIMSDLNIAVKRAPQDGRFQINIEGNQIDVRVSTYPTVYGENVVMRILDTRSILMTLDELGFNDEDHAKYEKLLRAPHGILLVTGPTGSGKTTTLYSNLNMLNSPKKNIMTIEDPVEYHLFGIRQAQINVKAGLTFSTGLRSILRQDPDIIMVGEIRDKETAEIAVQAALTGHLVLSTLHTNDAPSALTRLVDMGVEPFLLASSVIGIVAQRLVRTICPSCKETYKPPPEIIKELPIDKKDAVFYMGKGCKACKDIGYKGRTGIYELLIMNDQIKELVTARASDIAIRKAAQAAGMKTLRENGLLRAMSGVTTIDEIVQTTME